MAKKSAKQRAEDYVHKQERRVEALDLINQIAELQQQITPKVSEKDLQKESSLKKKKKKNKKNKKNNTDVSIEGTVEVLSCKENNIQETSDESALKENSKVNCKTELINLEKDETNNDQQETKRKSVFIDNRKNIVGFQNISKIATTSKQKRSYTWREKLELEERKRRKLKEDEYFNSSSDEDESTGPQHSENESVDDEDGDDEFTGFSGDEVDIETHNKIIQKENAAENVYENDSTIDDESADDDAPFGDEDEEVPDRLRLKSLNEKASSFMSWIESKTEKPAPTPILDIDYKPVIRIEDTAALSDEEEVKIYDDHATKKPAFYVNVQRDLKIQEQREDLPVFKREHDIMEAIKHNDIVIICGETGSGKTTQLPQFLFEAGYGNSQNTESPGMIGITQPRRVAAMSMAERVSSELGNYHNVVSYQIRFDSNVKPETRIKFMTDGVLLREMMSDFLLTKYSSIIIDEAHERNINTDILIGMLSRIVKLRAKKNRENPKEFKKLKLIIMSATLRVSDFSENERLFEEPPPVLKVEARMYPVSVHFNKITPHDYVNEAFRKTCKIHQRLPKGGILIFLTSQKEIMDLVKKLRQRFPLVNSKKKNNKNLLYSNDEDNSVQMRVMAKDGDIEDEEIDFSVKELTKEDIQAAENIDSNYQKEFDDEIDENEEEEGFDEELEDDQTAEDPLYVLPLYSLLPTKEQMKVFEKPPGNARICIVATNVAETSITIPNIRYVVDCGRSKQKVLNENNVQSYEVSWISKASSEQRSGRAGRTGPGHTYRLYSSAIFEEFERFSVPEILRMPIESVVLQMKSIGIDTITNFPFPTPVDSRALVKAEKLLQYLGALDNEAVVTKLGKQMSLFPLSPRFAKMLLTSNQLACLPYVITIICALSVGDLFLSEVDIGIDHAILNPATELDGEDDEHEDDKTYNKRLETKEKMRSLLQKYNKAQSAFFTLDKYSDALKILTAVSASTYYQDAHQREKFLKDHFIRSKVIEEIVKLRKQLLYIVKVNTSKDGSGVEIDYEKELKLSKPPNKSQIFAIKQIITTGFLDQIAIRADLVNADIRINKRSSTITIPYKTLYPATDLLKDKDLDPHVYIHPHSLLCSTGVKPPDYLVFQRLDLNAAKTKIRMRPLTDIEGKAITNLARKTPLLTYSKPLGPPYGPEMISLTKQKCYVIPRFGGIGSAVSWDLPPVRVIQKKVNGQWITE